MDQSFRLRGSLRNASKATTSISHIIAISAGGQCATSALITTVASAPEPSWIAPDSPAAEPASSGRAESAAAVAPGSVNPLPIALIASGRKRVSGVHQGVSAIAKATLVAAKEMTRPIQAIFAVPCRSTNRDIAKLPTM